MKPEERVDWRSFRAQLFETEALWHNPAKAHIFIAVADNP
jgi:hypothetical protein